MINTEEVALLAIIEREEGLEIRVNPQAYGNLALVGLLEKLKLSLLSEQPDISIMDETNPTNQKYDA